MTVKEKAYAKINLYLDVLGCRDDGFHDVKTVMHTVSLFDDIIITATPSDEIRITITSSDKTLETDENNLIYKSALKYMSHFEIKSKVYAELEKRIPIGAGLGGGSADSAATLRAMNRIYGLATKEQLLSMAAELGSDVPFCIDGGQALCTGKGEEISPLGYTLNKELVIAIGKSRVSTPAAYKLLDEKYGDFVIHNSEMAAFNTESIPIYNVFESVTALEEIDKIKKIIAENGATSTLMSGSGPAVFGIFDSAADAESAKAALQSQGFCAYRCKTI